MSNKYADISKVRITTLNKNGKTILDDVYFTSPIKVAPPFYKSDDFVKVIVMSSSAGTMDGDIQEYDITLGDNTKMELTSQSFEKIYTMIENEAKRDCTISIGKNSLLIYNLLPTIPFKDSAFNSNINIKLKDSSSKLIFMDIINCGRVAHGEKFKYKYYKSYVDIESNNKLMYVDNTNYNPMDIDMNNFGMYEGYTHFANMLIANFKSDDEILNNIRKILKDDDADGSASITQHNYISVKVLGYSSDKLLKISSKISEYLMSLDMN